MKILIVDDEPSIVNLIRMNLKLEGYDTVCAYTGREAVDAYAAEKPDIVLLDIMLPDMDGYDVLRAIQELDRYAAVIFITANDKRTSKILGLELGADDYITKPFDNKELVLRVKTLWRRIRLTRGALETAPADPAAPAEAPDRQKEQGLSLLTCGVLALDPEAHTVTVEGEEVALTYREFEVLGYLMKNRRRVLGREELLENIWGYSYMGNTRAVDILMRRLRQKLGAAGEYIRTVYGVGYRFEGMGKCSKSD